MYKFFQQLEKKYPKLSGRYQVSKVHGRFDSQPLRAALSFLEMGKALEVGMPNPVDQYYRARETQIDSLKKELVNRRILPDHENVINELAKEFAESV